MSRKKKLTSMGSPSSQIARRRKLGAGRSKVRAKVKPSPFWVEFVDPNGALVTLWVV